VSSRPVRVGVGLLVKRHGELLLVRRSGAHGAETWSPPGGNLDFGEDPHECAVREAREETAVEVTRPRFIGATNDVFESDGKHYVTLWFEADYDTGAVRAQALDEVSEVGWFAEDSLPAPLFAPFEQLLAGKVLAK
jgi:8-oxo-dGTP diphosphatase